MPEEWFSDEKAKVRKKCKVPETLALQAKNEIAQDLIHRVVESGKFPVKWIGCDAVFGSDRSFLRGLPEGVCYFAAVKENELVFVKPLPSDVRCSGNIIQRNDRKCKCFFDKTALTGKKNFREVLG